MNVAILVVIHVYCIWGGMGGNRVIYGQRVICFIYIYKFINLLGTIIHICIGIFDKKKFIQIILLRFKMLQSYVNLI